MAAARACLVTGVIVAVVVRVVVGMGMIVRVVVAAAGTAGLPGRVRVVMVVTMVMIVSVVVVKIVTMVVVGILAVAVVPRFAALSGFDAVAYRDKVRATLEYARKSAVAARRKVTVELLSDKLSLKIDLMPGDDPAYSAASTQSLALPARDSNCGGPTNQICPKSGSAVTLTATTASLTFDALGKPGNGATYTITGADSYTVTVEAETGYVH